jgi:dipeptidyl-peptidase 4
MLALWLVLPATAQKAAKTAPNSTQVPTLEDVWGKYSFLPAQPSPIEWTEDGRMYQLSEAGDLLRYNVENGNLTDTVLPARFLPRNKEGKAIEPEEYSLSPDGNYLLLSTNVTPIYRWSSTKSSYIVDLKARTNTPIHRGAQIGNTEFSPYGGRIAYTFDNNLYAQNLVTGAIDTISHDGKMNEIINGHSDWVYEEEFELVKAYVWSPDGRYVAYLQFDERKVPEFSMDIYGKTLYPTREVFKYPKAGEANSVIRLFVCDVTARERREIALGSDADQYIPRLYWPEGGRVVFFRMNRTQNKLEVLGAAPSSSAPELLLEEKSETYIELITNKMVFSKDGKTFLWLSENDGYNHAYLYETGYPAHLRNRITSGNWEVTSVYGVDQNKSLLYYQAAEKSPVQRQVYSIGLDGQNKQALAVVDGWNEAAFSPDFRYFLLDHSTANQPNIHSLHKADGTQLRVMEDNEKLVQTRKSYALLPKTFIQVPGADGTMLNGWMIRPPANKKLKKHPVLMFCYGGPGIQTVKDEYDRFDYYWYQVLASKGYIIVSVDGRGTGARGAAFKKSTYLDLGKLESDDQIAVAKWLGQQDYVDAKRIGLWGWSFGGYLTALSLTKSPETFRAGISVAPVTNWRFYDSIYTERFLRTPQVNAKGYDANSPVNYAKNLSARYFLIHGTGDDNVHVQNSMAWTNALIRANRPFQMFMYPDRNHGIYGGPTRLHLYTMMTKFILENL